MASTQSIGSSTNPFPVSGSGRIQRLIGRNDADGNGTLSLSEFETMRQTLPGASASSAASAGSSAAGDATSSAADQFSQIDTDGNGQLSGSELSAYRQKQRAAANSALLNLQEVFGGGQGGQASRGVGHHHRPPADAQDGDATAATAAASTSAGATGASGSALDSLFAQIDGDGNGAVSRGELSTFLVQAMASLTGSTGTRSATLDTSGPLATLTTTGTGA